MASDRATLDQIAAELVEADQRLAKALIADEGGNSDGACVRRYRCVQMSIWRCQGLVQQLRMPPIPPVRDAVDEASAELGETWD